VSGITEQGLRPGQADLRAGDKCRVRVSKKGNRKLGNGTAASGRDEMATLRRGTVPTPERVGDDDGERTWERTCCGGGASSHGPGVIYIPIRTQCSKICDPELGS